MRHLFMLLVGIFAVAVATPVTAAEVEGGQGVGPAPIEGMQMSPVIGQQEFERMQSRLDPRVRSGEVTPKQEGNTWAYPWTCVAQSTVSGLWYYWTAWNAYYARNQALSACVYANGYTCVVGCRVGY